VANADQAGRLLVGVAVSRCKLVSIAEEQQEVDLIRAVRIGGVPLRLDFGSIVVQDVEDEVRLMLMGADDAGVAGDVVSDQGVCAGSLFNIHNPWRITAATAPAPSFSCVNRKRLALLPRFPAAFAGEAFPI
jgi:hypothetical protein